MTDAAAIASLDSLESDLLLYIMRMLIHDEPAAIGRLICCCRALAQLTRTNAEECEEIRKARRSVARQRLFDLRQLAGRQPSPLLPSTTEIVPQLRPEVDEPHELDLSRWHRIARPDPRHASPNPGAEWTVRGTAVKRVLLANESLSSLDVSVCYLTHMDAAEIAKGLKINKTLTTLNASGNFFGGFGRDGNFIRASEGMDSIADALSVSALSSLILAENRLGPEGVRALMPGLTKSSLTSLDLSRNGIGTAGAAELAAGLAANSSLLKLDVRLNRLGPEGAKALAPGVAASGSLAVLDARFNGVGEGDEGEAALKKAAKGRICFHLMVCEV